MDIKPQINFDTWSKLDIRIGTIIQVTPVPETDKLLQLQVDFGTENRQIVSGIADKVDVNNLVGKQCPFIINLEPRVIRGVESNGMILAVGDGNNFALLHPSTSIDPGSTIR